MLLQFILLRDICKAPEQVIYADRLLGSIVFWHRMSHFSTGQSLTVLYSVVSVLSIVKVRHRNLVPLLPLQPPAKSFPKYPLFLSSLPSRSYTRKAGLVPSTQNQFYGRGHNPLGLFHKLSWSTFLSSLKNQTQGSWRLER